MQQETGCSREGFVVDVGEDELFYVEVPGALRYTSLHSSEGRLVVKAEMSEGGARVVRLRWSPSKRVAQSKGYAGMKICEALHFVPAMHEKRVHLVGSTFVGTVVRDYVQGDTLASVWPFMSQSEKAQMLNEVTEAVNSLSLYTSDFFWRLQGQNLATTDPVTALNYRILLSKVTMELKKGDIGTLNVDPFSLPSVLCHGCLHMEHIIVSGGKLAGIVGWSRCDYGSEIMDRMSYYFSIPMREQSEEWCNLVADIPMNYGYLPSMYIMSVMYYFYYIQMHKYPELADYIEELLRTASDCIISSLRHIQRAKADAAEVEGDRGSQDRHDDPSPDPVAAPPAAFDTPSRPQSIQSWEDWSDAGTVKDILDLL